MPASLGSPKKNMKREDIVNVRNCIRAANWKLSTRVRWTISSSRFSLEKEMQYKPNKKVKNDVVRMIEIRV